MFVIVFFVFLNLSLCLVLDLCSYVIMLMFKSVIMFLCVLVQNKLYLNLCILFVFNSVFSFFILFKLINKFLKGVGNPCGMGDECHSRFL